MNIFIQYILIKYDKTRIITSILIFYQSNNFYNNNHCISKLVSHKDVFQFCF